MKRYLVFLFFIVLVKSSIAQSFSYSGYVLGPVGGADGAYVNLFRRSMGNLNVKIFSTHDGNGSTAQYSPYPTTTLEFNRCFDTTYSHTDLAWSGSLPAATVLNWNYMGQLLAAGASVPNYGEFFSVEITATFVPTSSGLYEFGINSDDGSDLLINGVPVVTYYGGHGMSGPIWGTVNLVAGNSYSMKVRMQEYGGGDGLTLVWKKPGQSIPSLHLSELQTQIGSWYSHSMAKANQDGFFSFYEPDGLGYEYQLAFLATEPVSPITDEDAQAVSPIIFTQEKTALQLQMFDVNGDSEITVSDQYLIFAKRIGLIEAWPGRPKTNILSESQFNWIESNQVGIPFLNTDVFTTPVLTNGGTITVYLISPGYARPVSY